MTPCPERPIPPLATWTDAGFLAAAAVLALLAGWRPGAPAREVRVRSEGAVRMLPFVPGQLEVTGALGISRLELDPGGGIRFLASPCPGKDCVRLGRVAGAGAAIACLPNRILVELVGGASPGLDAVTR